MPCCKKEYWLKQRWNKLRLDPNQEFPEEWSEGSNKKYFFICECGKRSYAVFSKVSKHHTKSCGKCNYVSREELINKKFNKIKICEFQEIPEWVSPVSKLEYTFICDCGKKFQRKILNVFNSKDQTCTMCDALKREDVINKKYGKLRLIDKDLPELLLPSKKYTFICDCGNLYNGRFYDILREHSKSCGKCSHRPKEYYLNKKFGKLRLIDKDLPNSIALKSNKKYTFVCDYKNIFLCTMSNIIYGHKKSCGKCNFKTKEYWLSKKFGKLKLIDENLRDEWSYGCGDLMKFRCDCGEICQKIFQMVNNGHSKRCGKCSSNSKQYWLSKKFGKLKLIDEDLEDNIFPNSTKVCKFQCDCGRVKSCKFLMVGRGITESCGKCNYINLIDLHGKKFNKLTLIDKIDELVPPSTTKTLFQCECGKESKLNLLEVINGHSKSCGKCNFKPKEYWIKQKFGRLRVSKDNILEWSSYSSQKIKFQCDCGLYHISSFYHVFIGDCVSCQNCNSKISFKELEFKKYINKFYPKADKIRPTRKEIDIYIEDINLGIEFNGLIWHSDKYSDKYYDFNKYKEFNK